MPIVMCGQCQAKNRVARFRLSARATCGKCGSFLIEPKWLTTLRDLLQIFRKYWVLLTSAIILVVALEVHPRDDTPQQELPPQANFEPSGTVETAPTQALRPPLPKVEPLALPHITPVVLCVPVNVSSGAKKLYTHRPALAPLAITTPPGGNFVFRIVKNETTKYVMSIYMTGGETQEFKVPLGIYSIYAAQGQTWCGHDVAFGHSATRYTRLDATFAFSRETDGYKGHRIELVPQLMGNLDSTEVTAKEFSELVPDEMSASGRPTQ
ncbi:hypothetical protein PY254_04755 [Rhodanobacter sp. AS-Z3]|uniref:hypothetical protein n=1 Tax=Rhodanobacter sp. AS-Z3 TaxID=3031330 RepID=UPI0024788425|nr:hypothetical protein [Rhodanobacter sp. AS-Z3]WEN15986.1 hypothetical protein PY254_04755 [Rhodanobacter sp. AS-Z3]